MRQRDIAALLDEPACSYNKKLKTGCARPKPGATAGGCAFDGAQIALLPMADVAHIVHGSIACAGNSWDNRGTRSSGPTLFKIGMTTDLTERKVARRAKLSDLISGSIGERQTSVRAHAEVFRASGSKRLTLEGGR